MTYYKSLNPASSGLNASYALHNILFFACIYLLSDGSLTHVDGCTCLLGDYTDLFRGETGTEQTAYLHFLIRQYLSELFHHAGIKAIV